VGSSDLLKHEGEQNQPAPDDSKADCVYRDSALLGTSALILQRHGGV
jgi:hypothetical protein